MKRSALGLGFVAAAVFLLPVAYLAFAAASSAHHHGYGFSEMDWDMDGEVALSEFFASADVGAREVLRGGTACREFFSLKDGLPIREECPRAVGVGRRRLSDKGESTPPLPTP